MKTIEIETGRLGYRDVIQYVLKNGKYRSPRGIQTLDAGPTTILVADTTDALPMGCGRGLKQVIGAVEAVQLIGSFSDPGLTFFASPNFMDFAEDDGQFYGAYGRRIGYQLNNVAFKLENDPDTRQAVITLWDPTFDNSPGKRDYPCTVALHFAIIDNKLEMTTTMRSNDVWLGFPYDIFQFTQLQWSLARALRISPGIYRHTAWSFHMYATDFASAENIFVPDRNAVMSEYPLGIGDDGDGISKIKQRARQLPYVPPFKLTKSEQWYYDQFAGFAP